MLKNIHIAILRIIIKRSYFLNVRHLPWAYGSLCVLGRTFRLNRSSVVILSLVILNKLILQESGKVKGI